MLKRFLAAALIAGVRVYQLTLSPHLGGACRFLPSCSEYAIEAIQVHGPLRGGLLAVRRVLSCHPFHAGGFDPVPVVRPHGELVAPSGGGPHGS